MALKRKTLTPMGVAGVLVRGLRANFSPEHRRAETIKLIDLLHDMAMARDGEQELGLKPREWANSDADWLESMANFVERLTPNFIPEE